MRKKNKATMMKKNNVDSMIKQTIMIGIWKRRRRRWAFTECRLVFIFFEDFADLFSWTCLPVLVALLEINRLMASSFVAVSFFLHSFVACKEWITCHWLFCMSSARETWKNCTGTHRYRHWSYQRQLTASTCWCLPTLIQPFLATLIQQWHLLSHRCFC